ncbi:MAG: PAS domain-containing protein [Planctomycetes bacterium]|nr:PAS domain-containing protein [Planctomycetota bacterium]
MKKFTTTVHINFTLTCLLVTMLFMAIGIGLVPSKVRMNIENRQKLCENLAIQFLGVAHDNIIYTLESLGPHIIERNPDIISMGFRDAEGKVVSGTDNHEANWQPLADGESTPTQIQIPVNKGDEIFGTIEIFFAPVYPKTLAGFLHIHYIYFVLFMAAAMFAVNWIYFKKVLRHLDPSSVIPSRVKAVLDNLTESVVILDKDEQIIFGNEAFGKTVDETEKTFVGRKLSIFPWIQPRQKQELCDLPWIQTLEKGTTEANVPIILKTKDGNKRTSVVNSVPILSAAGEHRGIMTSFTDVTELEEKNNELVKMSRDAGMAEIATNVLHNIGNMLNNVNVSATVIGDTLSQSKLLKLQDVSMMIQDHSENIGAFLSEDERGKHIPPYLVKTIAILLDEHKDITKTIKSLRNNIEHIKTVIRSQQSYAKVQTCEEIASIREIMEDAIKMNQTVLTNRKIDIVQEYDEIDYINIDRSRIMQITVNLIKNAAEALNESDVKNKRIAIKCNKTNEDQLKVEVIDNGIGIAPENIAKIFAYGYTTKPTGHGFGLHACVLSAKEIGGDLIAHSQGPGLGASFILTLPLNSEKVNNGKPKESIHETENISH